MSRYARQMNVPAIGAAGQARLGQARVLVVGAGGLGSPALLYLAGAGVGQLTVVDDDVVELSNLHRQIIFTEQDLGRSKAEAAAARAAALNSEITVTPITARVTDATAPDLVAGHDVVIDGADQFAVTYALSDACQDAGIPLIASAVVGLDGYMAVCCKDAPSFRALFPEAPTDAPSCAEAGVLGPLPGVFGTLQASEAIKLIAGFGETLTGRFLQLDLSDLRTYSFSFAQAPEPERPAGTFVERRPEDGLPDGAVLVDVRAPGEVVFGMLPEARHIPLDQVGERSDEMPADRPVALYCAAGPRAQAAATQLQKLGFRDLHVLAGGYRRWRAALVGDDDS